MADGRLQITDYRLRQTENKKELITVVSDVVCPSIRLNRSGYIARAYGNT